jgi:pimeloyl-ACP methyl ester carboxylesterase
MADLRPPSVLSAAYESLTPLELARLSLSLPRLVSLPRGDGRPVLLFPGYSSDDASTLALRAVLRGLGHDARGWGLGRNVGDVEARIEQVADLVGHMAERLGEPVALVGWSLGGYLAREAARDRPEAVSQVVTLGSPIAGGPKYTQLAPLYRARGADLDEIEDRIREREAVSLRVPVTALYSRLDGVVQWRACVDRTEAVTENVEVRTTHLGFGFSAEVYGIVAERLVAPLGVAA